MLVPHEPPAMRLLPDEKEWLDFFLSVYGTYESFGVEAGMARFRERTFPEADRVVMSRAPTNEFTPANTMYWFEHELRQYPSVDLDIDALRVHAGRIIPMAGRESRGYACYQASAALSERLGRDLMEMPGGHVGYASKAAEFARELEAVLPRQAH
jgi:hypothetical protein